SYVIAHADGTADFFIAPAKVDDALKAHLGNAVRIRPRSDFAAALTELAGKTVAVDPQHSVAAIFDAVEGAGARLVEAGDPCLLPKAIKNPAEIAGHRAAQALD